MKDVRSIFSPFLHTEFQCLRGTMAASVFVRVRSEFIAQQRHSLSSNNRLCSQTGNTQSRGRSEVAEGGDEVIRGIQHIMNKLLIRSTCSVISSEHYVNVSLTHRTGWFCFFGKFISSWKCSELKKCPRRVLKCRIYPENTSCFECFNALLVSSVMYECVWPTFTTSKPH